MAIEYSKIRETFGGALATRQSIQNMIIDSEIDLRTSRWLVLAAADKMDKFGPKGARDHISMVKIAAPKMCQEVADRALQAHGGMGVTQDTPIARIYLTSRYCRIADGPDEVHMSQLGRRTIRDLNES